MNLFISCGDDESHKALSVGVDFQPDEELGQHPYIGVKCHFVPIAEFLEM
jgi:hypothetical protein